MLLLSSLLKAYEGIVDTLVYGRETLDMAEVKAALDTKEIQKKSGHRDGKVEVLWVKDSRDCKDSRDNRRGRSRGRSQGKWNKGKGR